MKKQLYLTACALVFSTASYSGDLFVYGSDEDNQRGRLNALEMSSNERYQEFRALQVGLGLGQVVTGVGYLNDGLTFKQVCKANGYRCKNFGRDFETAKTLKFEIFNVTRTTCTDLKLVYHRHGSEIDTVEVTKSGVSANYRVGPGAEARKSEHEISLPDLSAVEEMTINIEYEGGAADNGHFIDYIAITGEC